MSFPLVCLCNPLLDLQVDVEPSYLEKYSLKENDAILAEEKHLPIYDEVINQPGLHIVAGGAGQNSARAAQYVLPPKSVVYFGSVGNDQYADLLIKANEKAGLTTKYQVQTEHETGKCAALINGLNRSLVTDLAAANHFTLSHLEKPENEEIIKGGKVFYIGGFHLTVSPEAIIKLGKEAAAHNDKISVINFSAPFIPEFFKDQLDKCLPYMDYVICNETEAEAYASSHGYAEPSNLVETAKLVAKTPKENTTKPRIVVFTHGTEPTVVVKYDFATEKYEISEYPVHPISVDKIKDTNGAGDAFAGGFIAGLVKGLPMAKAVDLGQWTAKVSIQEIGPSFPYDPKVTYESS
ncbi:adenosine kinase [Saccharomycopsis crataegensis]|uniref:Adenosine kinase n=1 Tax=Saccharomycopsis crataegensis TaxID=43959 RepID=A0AAV5QUC2_9ASCO|nr:adenosine kinase [Saccharomycopsis crataegensis]